MGLLDRVNNTRDGPPARQEDSRDSTSHPALDPLWDEKDFFGDNISKKQKNVLRVGYQNIRGLSFNSNSLKDDII
jgi:hypothetical protein